jgi:catalase
MFAYADASRYRLGTNYQQLPCNAAHSAVYCPFQRDGFMNFSTNYGEDPNYVGSSLKPTTFWPATQRKSTITEHEKWAGEISSFTTHVVDEDFEQAAGLWKVLGKDPGHQDRFIGNVADNLRGVTDATLRSLVYGTFPQLHTSWFWDKSGFLQQKQTFFLELIR